MLKRWLDHTLTDVGFRGPVLTLLSGSSLALLIGYAADLVLTRLYTPLEYDIFAAFTFIYLPLHALGALRYEDALMLPDTDEEAAPLLGLVVGVSIAITVLLFLGVLAVGTPLAAYFGHPSLGTWLWLLPVLYLLERLRHLSELWLTRQSRFRPTTAANVSQTLTNKGLALGLGMGTLKQGAAGLFMGFIVSRVAALLVLVRAVRPWPVRRPSSAQTRALLHRYRRFPLFSCPSALINAALAALPVLLLGGVFADAFMAHYHRVFHTIAVPLGLVGGAVGQVFFVRSAEADRDGTLTTLTTTVHRRLVAIGLFPTLAVVVAGPDLFAFVFSEPWRPAGVFAQVLAPWLFLASVASPLTRLFDVLERQRLDLMSSMIMLVLIGTSLAALFFSQEPGPVLLALGIAGVLARSVHLAIMMRIAGARPVSALLPYALYILCALPGLALLYGVAHVFGGTPGASFGAAAFGFIGYAGLAWMAERYRS